MVGHERDSFVDLERHRLALEQNVAKLRASLQHWRAWEIEYEGMKEDISKLGDDVHRTDLGHLGEDIGEPAFPGHSILLTSKERRLLLRDEKGNLREIQQVLGLLSRRVDYVQQNIKSVSSLLTTAEEKYAASQILIQPEVRHEEGLPLTEILEELDSEGNVISSSTSEPGRLAPQVAESLREAGLTDLPSNEEAAPQAREALDGESTTRDSTVVPKKPNQESPRIEELDSSSSVSSAPTHDDIVEKSPKPRKGVSFAEGTKEENLPTLQCQARKGTRSESNGARPTMPKDKTAMRNDIADSDRRSITLYDEEEDKPFDPVIPKDESPKDAALRREMIQYNMGEVGAIVAELDLGEDDAPCSDCGSDEDRYESSSLEEEEDQFGRSSGRVLTDDYLAEMQKLQQRLTNIGHANAQGATSAIDICEIGEESCKGNTSSKPSQPSKARAAKGVRFAEKLDIQEAPAKPRATTPPSTSDNNVRTNVPQKPIHTPTVIERPYNPTNSFKPAEPDEYDPGLLRQEVKTEYHRMRNHFIQRQGGFAGQQEDEESDVVPLTEAEGGPKRMSRFKAARLANLGT